MSPKLHTKIEMRAPATLVEHPRNARKHASGQLKQIMESLKRYGFTMPVIVDPEGVILAGHARTAAALKLGMPEVPVIVVQGWTDAQKRAYLIADNQLTLAGDWDTEKLRGELEALQESLFDVSLTGLPTAQVHRLTVPRAPKDSSTETITSPMGNKGGEFLEWNGHLVPMTPLEVKALNAALAGYIKTHKNKGGFMRALMDGRL